MENQTKEVKKFNKCTIIGFVLSIFSITLFDFGMIPILAIIFNSIGLSQTIRGQQKGKGFAIAGLAIGIIYFFVYLYTYGHLGNL